MRTNRAVARASSEQIAMRPIVDKHLWKHYLPLAVGKNMKENQYINTYQILHSSAVNLKRNAEWTLGQLLSRSD